MKMHQWLSPSTLTRKFIAMYVLVLCAAIGVGQWYELRALTGQLRQSMLGHGANMSEKLSAQVQAALVELGESDLDDLGRLTTSQEFKALLAEIIAGVAILPEIRFICIHGRDGSIVMESGELGFCTWNDRAESIPEQRVDIRLKNADAEEIIDLLTPVHGGKTRSKESMESLLFSDETDHVKSTLVGVVHLGLDLSEMKATIRESQMRNLRTAIVLILLSVIAIIIMVRKIMKPLRTLLLATRKIAAGDLDVYRKSYSIDELGELEQSFDEMTKVLQSTRRELSMQAAFLQNAVDIAIATDMNLNIIYLNESAVKVLGIQREKVIGHPVAEVLSGDGNGAIHDFFNRVRAKGQWNNELLARRTDGTLFPLDLASIVVRNDTGYPHAIIAIGRDVSEQRRLQQQLQSYAENLESLVAERTREMQETHQNLKNAQVMLLQSEKLAAIGQLAAGVAHEINNPIGFVKSNLFTLTSYVAIIKEMFTGFNHLSAAVRELCGNNAEVQGILERITTLYESRKVDVILEDIDPLLSESMEGVIRVQEIVQNLKRFAHADKQSSEAVNINECIENALKMVWNELKYKAVIRKMYGKLPLIQCHEGQLAQVIMNLLVNAVQAIQESGEIVIETGVTETHVMIRLSDNGMGIPRQHLSKVFEPFFTTKPVGIGTGLGLSISYGIIQAHHGTITVDSEEGKGATFTIELPISGAQLNE